MKKRSRKKQRSRQKTLQDILAAACMVLVCSAANTFTLPAAIFSDVATASYEGQAAITLQQRGILTGFPDGTFRGNEPVNRAQAAKILLLAGDYTLRFIENEGSIPDIERNAWYEQFALNAIEHGIMNGYPDGTFGPSKPILRSEFLKMLSNAMQGESALPYHYTDVQQDSWFSPYAGAAEKYNLFLYDKAQLLPSAPMSRDEVAWAVYQMLIQRKYNFVIRTPFDYAFTNQPDMPITEVALKPAAPAASSAASSSSVLSPTAGVRSSAGNSVAVAPTGKTCTDSDETADHPNGFNQETRGTAINLLMAGPSNTYEDSCIDGTNVLYEYYCNEQGYLARDRVNCPLSCHEGACTLSPLNGEEEIDPRRPTGTLDSSASAVSGASSSAERTGCSDTDSTPRFPRGSNVYAKGTTNGLLADQRRVSYTDSCKDSSTLQEFSCQENGLIRQQDETCALGCTNGACVSPGATGQCTDEDADSVFPDGKNFIAKARLFVNHPEEGNVVMEDYCESSSILYEYICGTDGRVGKYRQACACNDGKCVE